MKKPRKNCVKIIVAILMLLMLSACSSNKYDTGITNEQVYENYDVWNEANEIRLITNARITTETIEVSEEELFETGDKEIPKNKVKEVQKLKEGIVSFFKEIYGIDVSERMEAQEIAVYSPKEGCIEEGVMGYVTLDNPNILNLNEKLFKEYSDLFKTTYIHETVHFLGVQSDNMLMIEEGITDALTDMISCYIGFTPVLTEYYFESRTLAYQLLAADPEIVSCYLEGEDFDILERINEKLKHVPQTFIKSVNLGNSLEKRVDLLYHIAIGRAGGYSNDPYVYAWEAQEIVKAYCQECQPDEKVVDYIRSHYLVLEYELLEFEEGEEGYIYYMNSDE